MRPLRYRHRNATGIDYLDRLIGEEGIKTNVNVNIPPQVYIGIGITLFLGIVGAVYVSKTLAKK